MVPKIENGKHVIVIDGNRTLVTITGNGKPLVLLHGLGGPLMWEKVIEPLSRAFRVYVIHLPGFGESDSPKEYFSTKMYAEFLGKILDTLGLQHILITGISYGGQIAVTFAHTHPDRIEKLILIASTGMDKGVILVRSKISRTILSLLGKYVILQSKFLICLFGRFSFYDLSNRPRDLCRKFYQQLSGKNKRNAWLHSIENIFTEQSEIENILPQLRLPTLIMWGKQDVTLPLQSAYIFQKKIVHSQLVILTECAHSLPLEKPNECSEIITSFAHS